VIRHLLVTNDFPPKMGGIQSYLWELWRRLPSDDFVVLTTPHPDAAEWDRAQPYRIVRTPEKVLLPAPGLGRRIDALADDFGAEVVVLDPALPIGHLGPSLRHRYAVVLHGAEVTVPGRLPLSRQLLGRVLRGAALVIAAGGYPAAEGVHAAGRALPVVDVPPGVDIGRFVPIDDEARRAVRTRYGIDPDAFVVLGLSRLVPRKGFDVVIRAATEVAHRHREVVVAIGGAGRDRDRLEKVAAEIGAPARFLGRVPEADLPLVHASADVFAMLCHNRWGGLEQEGFGIVFLEAAAAGVPAIAGRSGGSHEAVIDGRTGLVIDRPRDASAVAAAIESLVTNPDRRRAMGAAARAWVSETLTYDLLAERLKTALDALAQ
jgi:phosphatidylinositol alpha-1,6-mannosyltransferase